MKKLRPTLNSSRANRRLSNSGDRRWARRAPKRAKNMLVVAIPSNAGRYTKPTLHGGRFGFPQPVNMKLKAPAMAIGKPQAAEVATACWIGTLRQTRKGTVNEPPPIPKIAEAQPITPPATVSVGLPGTPRLALGFRSSDNCAATTMAKVPMIFCSNGPWISAAVIAPSAAPSRIPRVSQRNSGQRTAPLR